MNDSTDGIERNRSSSLRRALSMLDAVARANNAGQQPTLKQIAALTGLNRSTAARLLQPLLEARLIAMDPTMGTHSVGPQAAYLGQAYLGQLDVARFAYPFLRALVDDTGETAHLGVQDSTDVVYIAKVESPRSVRMVSQIGSRQPLYRTAMGKLFLAYGETSLLAETIEHGLAPATPTTITDPEVLVAAVARVKESGEAIDDTENELDIRCAAAPVFNHTGGIVAAISLSGPASRMTHERLAELMPRVRRCAADLSEALGADPAR